MKIRLLLFASLLATALGAPPASAYRPILELQGGAPVILCDLCGRARECFQKEIEGREFDICADCWRPLEEKLKGKGRVKRERDMVMLPQTAPQPEEPHNTPPGLPPKILGTAPRAK